MEEQARELFQTQLIVKALREATSTGRRQGKSSGRGFLLVYCTRPNNWRSAWLMADEGG